MFVIMILSYICHISACCPRREVPGACVGPWGYATPTQRTVDSTCARVRGVRLSHIYWITHAFGHWATAMYALGSESEPYILFGHIYSRQNSPSTVSTRESATWSSRSSVRVRASLSAVMEVTACDNFAHASWLSKRRPAYSFGFKDLGIWGRGSGVFA